MQNRTVFVFRCYIMNLGEGSFQSTRSAPLRNFFTIIEIKDAVDQNNSRIGRHSERPGTTEPRVYAADGNF